MQIYSNANQISPHAAAFHRFMVLNYNLTIHYLELWISRITRFNIRNANNVYLDESFCFKWVMLLMYSFHLWVSAFVEILFIVCVHPELSWLSIMNYRKYLDYFQDNV